MAKVDVYHAINEEEKEILIDIHEIQQECIREMKKKYPKYKIEIVDDRSSTKQGQSNETRERRMCNSASKGKKYIRDTYS